MVTVIGSYRIMLRAHKSISFMKHIMGIYNHLEKLSIEYRKPYSRDAWLNFSGKALLISISCPHIYNACVNEMKKLAFAVGDIYFMLSCYRLSRVTWADYIYHNITLLITQQETVWNFSWKKWYMIRS